MFFFPDLNHNNETPVVITELIRSRQCSGYTGQLPADKNGEQQVWMSGCVDVKQGLLERAEKEMKCKLRPCKEEVFVLLAKCVPMLDWLSPI